MPAIPLDAVNLKAIVFDLDNTLVTSEMDFQWLRRQVGCPADQDVLSYVDAMPCSIASANGHQLILQHELEDAVHSHPMPGCSSLLDFIETHKLHTAIITRNCSQAAQQKILHNQLNISRVISREHYPPKPAPDSLLALADEWQLRPAQILYVGDYLYDLQAAFNAQMPSCLVTHAKATSFTEHASVAVHHLYDLQALLERHFLQK